MASPIELYEDIAKQFNITGSKRVHPRQIRAYVGSQVQEQALIINRLIVDIAIATKDLETAKEDATVAAYSKKVADFSNDLRQLSKTLDFFIELDEELAKAYPEVDPAKDDRKGF